MLFNLPTLPPPSVLVQINPVPCGLVIIVSTPLKKKANSNLVLCAVPGVLLISALALLAALLLSLASLTNWRTFYYFFFCMCAGTNPAPVLNLICRLFRFLKF